MKDKVYYDDNCYVCSFEINAIRERGQRCGIEFVDISSPDFQESGDYESEMIGEFEGERTVGAETFRSLYEKMGFKRAVWFSRLPVIRHLFDGSYWVFAHIIRPRLPHKNKN